MGSVPASLDRRDMAALKVGGASGCGLLSLSCLLRVQSRVLWSWLYAEVSECVGG